MAKKFQGVSYYGGQNGAGHYQRLINMIPKVDVHIEAFLGYSGVFNNIAMRPGTEYFGFDRDEKVVTWWNSHRELCGTHSHFVHCDYTAVKLLLAMWPAKSFFIHFDPPYRNTASPKKYLFDIVADDDFRVFLEFVLSMAAETAMRASRVYLMVSHWFDVLFHEYLCRISDSQNCLWQDLPTLFVHHAFKTQSRKGQIDNGVYVNYDVSKIELADSSYAGSGFTERQRIKRKVERNVSKILSMPALERDLIVSELYKKL